LVYRVSHGEIYIFGKLEVLKWCIVNAILIWEAKVYVNVLLQIVINGASVVLVCFFIVLMADYRVAFLQKKLKKQGIEMSIIS